MLHRERDVELYHGLATFAEVTFVDVYHTQISTVVIEVYPWYFGFVTVIAELQISQTPQSSY